MGWVGSRFGVNGWMDGIWVYKKMLNQYCRYYASIGGISLSLLPFFISVPPGMTNNSQYWDLAMGGLIVANHLSRVFTKLALEASSLTSSFPSSFPSFLHSKPTYLPNNYSKIQYPYKSY